MKLIPLTKGKFAMVDDKDFERVNQFKWFAQKMGHGFYAARTIVKPDGKKFQLYLHHFLLPGVARVDHRDGNSLNDQTENIRPATKQQNSRGFQRKKLGATSKFRGVCWNKRASKWIAQIHVTVGGDPVHLGCFINEEDAARAYDSAAVFYFGEWASTNFPIGEISIT